MKKELAAAALAALLTACSPIASDPDTLLTPPMLNRQQASVYEALAATLDMSEVVPKYPQNGELRTPYIFYDMDGDGNKEAIVFYSLRGDTANTRLRILVQRGDEWVQLQDLAMNREQVDFVQFSRILGEDTACLLIGWSNTGSRGADNILSAYSLKNGTVIKEITQQRYNACLIEDFDQDGLEEIVVAEREKEGLTLTLLTASSGHIAPADTQVLCADAGMLLQMISGPLWDGSRGIYIDEVRTDSSTATEVVRVREDSFELLVGGDQPATLDEASAWEAYTDTWRDDRILSHDYNGDSVIEVPYLTALPGNIYEGNDSPLLLTGLMQLAEGQFLVPEYAVINEDENYLITFPEDWLDVVSVLRDQETGIWRFYTINEETGEPEAELLRIQTLTEAPADNSNYILLGQRGRRLYYGYIPLTTGSVPGISETQLKKMFHQFS